MKCNKPQLTPDEPKKFVVKACQDVPEKIIRYGDPNMKILKSNPKFLKSHLARLKCSSAKSKLTARYWSSRNWYYFIRWRQTHFYFCRGLRSRACAHGILRLTTTKKTKDVINANLLILYLIRSWTLSVKNSKILRCQIKEPKRDACYHKVGTKNCNIGSCKRDNKKA